MKLNLKNSKNEIIFSMQENDVIAEVSTFGNGRWGTKCIYLYLFTSPVFFKNGKINRKATLLNSDHTNKIKLGTLKKGYNKFGEKWENIDVVYTINDIANYNDYLIRYFKEETKDGWSIEITNE